MTPGLLTYDEIMAGYVDAATPGLVGYAYNADTWCKEDGQWIARRLAKKLAGKVTHDDLCDPDQFPVPFYESAGGGCCAHCGGEL